MDDGVGPEGANSQGWGEQSGEAKSLKEIATREGIDNRYVSPTVNLTTLFDLAVDPPGLWDEQRERVGL